jgi:hypothetical protein
MKKLFILFLHFIIIFNIYSNDTNAQLYPSYYWGINGFDIFWNPGSVAGGYNFSSYNFEISATAVNFFLEHEYTHIGMEFNFAKIISIYDIKEQNWIQNVHFLNLNLYWNPFDFEKIIIGPFVAMNYITQNDDGIIDWSSIRINTGIRFFWRTNSHDYYKICFQKIGGEIGYKNNNGIDGLYFNINIDFTIAALAALFYVFGININM